MKWIEKKVRHADANITQTGKTWTARVRFKLPDDGSIAGCQGHRSWFVAYAEGRA